MLKVMSTSYFTTDPKNYIFQSKSNEFETLREQNEYLREQNEDLRNFLSDLQQQIKNLQEQNEDLRHFTFYEQQRLESSLQYMTEAKYKAEVMTKDIMDTVEMTQLELSVCNKNYDELLNFSKTVLNNILKKYKN